MKCSSLCFNKAGDNYFEDDLSNKEEVCMANCFHKTFNFLAHANTVHTFFTGDEKVINQIISNET